jgi:hypothetical protein
VAAVFRNGGRSVLLRFAASSIEGIHSCSDSPTSGAGTPQMFVVRRSELSTNILKFLPSPTAVRARVKIVREVTIGSSLMPHGV